MLRERFQTDSQPRRKNGAPPHATTGVARMSSIHTALGDGECHSIAIAKSGSDSAAPTQNRRVMSASSGLRSAPAAGIIGSSAMPQIGQLPRASRITSGCIGQVQEPAPEGGADLALPANRPGSASNPPDQHSPQKQYCL